MVLIRLFFRSLQRQDPDKISESEEQKTHAYRFQLERRIGQCFLGTIKHILHVICQYDGDKRELGNSNGHWHRMTNKRPNPDVGIRTNIGFKSWISIKYSLVHCCIFYGILTEDTKQHYFQASQTWQTHRSSFEPDLISDLISVKKANKR